MLNAWTTLTSPENGGTLSAIGLIVTIIAFGLTLWQLIRTQNAVRAVTEEIDLFRGRLRREEANRLTSATKERVKRAIILLKGDFDDRIFDELHDLRTSLVRLSSFSDIVAINVPDLTSYQKRISNYITSNEKMGHTPRETDKDKIVGSLRKLSGTISEIDGKLMDGRK